MAFKWEVYEPEEDTALDQSSGEVDIDNLTIDDVCLWEIMEASPARAQALEAGSQARGNGPSAGGDCKDPSDGGVRSFFPMASNGFTQMVTLIAVVLMGLTFLIVVFGDVVRGNLNFEKYTTVIMSFLSGIGVMMLRKGK